MDINLNLVGRYASENGSEIPAFDAISKQLFVVAGDVVEILDLSDTSTNITKIGDLPLNTEAVGDGFALLPNSVAVGKQGTVSEGIVAVALAIVETATGNQARGEVQFFDSTTGEFLGKQTVGFLPDMVAFTPDGTKVLTANEGEPNEDYTFDPEGSISIIDLSLGVADATVQEATFTAFNDQVDELRASGVRIFGPNATVAQDVEPEYITFSGDGTKAWVTLQENNAIAIVDIATATVESIVPLGFKDHSLEGNGIDPSDRDGMINIRPVPVFGMYMPDSIASYTVNGQTYYITANEGDARVRPTDDGILDGFDEGDIYNEEIRVGNARYILDPVAFPNASELKDNANLGRLTVTNTLGQSDRAIFVSSLDGTQEVNPVETEAMGNAFNFVDDNGFLQVELTVTGLDFGAFTGNFITETTDDDVTMFHIHQAVRGANGGVVWDILADPDTVITVNEDGTANITSTWQENTIPKTAKGEDTEFYFNLHTVANPPGEIRGQIIGEVAYDKIYAFGSRSFSIWDSEGNLVFDSGDDFEQITAEAFPDFFNASNSNNNFDDRSDNKGPEPEGVTVGTIKGQTYAFVGLERIGGVMVYNVTNPETPEFVEYINTRNFEEDPRSNLTDSGAEGLIFISAEDSPKGKPLLVVSNEVSNTTTVFEIEVPQTNFTLQLLHASDQEAGIPALQDAIGFSAVMNALDARYENTLKLASGDLFIAGPFFNASVDLYGQLGIADILVQNALGWDAAAVGNHEFDAGTSAFYNAIAPNFFIDGVGIDPETGYLGALFPYLSTNLDYSTDSSNLKNLVVESGEAPLPNSLTESVVIDVNGEQVGVIGAVVPYLPQIANIGGITMLTDPTIRDIEINAQNLANNIQPFVDELISQGINKIILMTHLQEFEMEQALATKLTGVDIIMGGGSHRVMANDDDILREDETQFPPELLQPYPQVFQDADGNDVYLINTGANYRYLGQLIVEFDAEGKIIMIGDDSGTFATDIEGVDRLYEEDITTFEQVKAVANPDIVAVVDNVGDFINSKDGTIFGNTEVWLNGLRSDVRTEETNLGNLTADANLWYAQQYGLEVDISVKNGGGIRDQIGVSFIDGGTNELVQLPPQANPAVGKEEGDISILDIENSLRFDNKLSVADISAQGIKDLAEHFVARWEQGVTPGQFGQIGGFSFSFDPTQTSIEFTRDANGDATGVTTPGERIQNLILNREDGIQEAIVLDGELVVNVDRTYKMVILDFLAGGGDGYPAFYFENVVRLDELTADNLPNNSNLPIGGEQDALAEYLAEFHPTAEEAFNQPDTPIEQDTRIQNLNFREDSLLDNPVTINIGNNGGTFDFGSRTNDLVIVGGDGDDNITTGSGFDRIVLGGGNNIVNAGAGDDVIVSSGLDGVSNQIDGGEGFDTVIYDGVFADFAISVENGVVTVGSNTDTLINIEQLQFNDRTVLVEDLVIDPILDDQIYRFRTGNGTYLYVGDEERQRVLEGNYGFVYEGEAFKVSFEDNDELIPIYRFRNTNLTGAYLYVGEEERQNLLNVNNFGFVQEGLAFYTYGADAQKGEDIYRFSTVPGGYIFVGEAERQSIQQNYSSFNLEGIAFEVIA
ncbi:choice-of-anchor I family protein [Geminocystis sp. CENA526]|uniref:choice-of-anchor I family protein n=1 Tax=Geminocystis sp. CENA526 TaxID=1355871 RepID=UPI003D6FF70B